MCDALTFKEAEEKIKDIVSKHQDVLKEVVNFLYENFNHYNWVGIYVVQERNLILGPWNGEHATEHTKIPIGLGVCGSAVASSKTELVPDVNKDDRYLACFISTKSEIVVPIYMGGKVVGEIDIDSDKTTAFTNEDKLFLEKIADMLSKHI